MRAFLVAFVTAFVIAGISSFVLEGFQSSSDKANTTSGVRLDFAKDGVNRTLPK
jgi:hypothetical protein